MNFSCYNLFETLTHISIQKASTSKYDHLSQAGPLYFIDYTLKSKVREFYHVGKKKDMDNQLTWYVTLS